MTDLFDQLDIDPVDREAIGSWLSQLTDAERVRVNELTRRLREGIGDWQGRFSRGVFDDGADIDHRLALGALPVLALMATADDVHAAHVRRGIPDDISWTTLAELGQQMRVSRWVRGTPSLAQYWWMTNAWSDGFARLGRLQFELLDAHDSTPVLGVHIPDSGPLIPAEVDAAFAQAPGYFAEHYPEAPPAQFFECGSWLLDPSVAALVPGSNMAAFQARWTPTGPARDCDRDGLFFGFHIEPTREGQAQDPAFLDTLPTETRLHRGLVQLWRDGGHVQVVTGRIPITRAAGAH